jgi:hypothetical protein
MKNQTAIITAVLLTAAALTITTTMSLPVASAQDKKENAQDGLNEADVNVHENTDSEIGDLSEQDIRFHEGTCQGGHSTDVLDTITGGGCPTEGFDPGNSDENRQD